MLNELRTFFDHSRHTLRIRGVDARLDVQAFHGEEHLSQPFTYGVEFTCTQHDLGADQLLNQDASFSLHAVPQKLPFLGPLVKPLRTLPAAATSPWIRAASNRARQVITPSKRRISRPEVQRVRCFKSRRYRV